MHACSGGTEAALCNIEHQNRELAGFSFLIFTFDLNVHHSQQNCFCRQRLVLLMLEHWQTGRMLLLQSKASQSNAPALLQKRNG
jgi:hypothetical protein